MANPTSNFGWQMPTNTDLVKDLPADFEVFGQAVDTSLMDLKGGTTGQVLSKASNTDMDFTWVTSDDANAIQNAIVDAKGDLIAASAADTPARLAVGNNGESLVADDSTSTGLRYNPQNALANPFINGAMEIAQRGSAAVTLTAAAFQYPVDRWQAIRASGTTGATAQQISNIGLTNFNNAIRIQRTAGNTATNDLSVAQNLETINSIPFAGRTVTLSFWARKGADFSSPSSAIGIRLYSGTGTDQSGFGFNFTGVATPISVSQVITTSWVRYAVTGTIASSATQLQVFFFYTPSGTAGAADSFDITGVQLDLGTYTASSAPAFRRSGGTLAGELQLAQRYYQKSYSQATAPASVTADNGEIFIAVSATNTQNRTGVRFSSTMRTAPTVTIYSTNSGTAAKIYNETTTTDLDGVTAQIGDAAFIYRPSSGTTSVGDILRIQWQASAEL